MTNPDTHQNHRILIIDDEYAIHEDFHKILGGSTLTADALDHQAELLFGTQPSAGKNPKLKYELDSALQGEEGVNLVSVSLEKQAPYAMAFVDMRMPPGIDGVETIEQVWQLDPDVQIVICTAYSDHTWEDLYERLGRTDRLLILKKPFDTVEVCQIASALCEKWQLVRQARSHLQELERTVAIRTAELKQSNDDLRREISQRQRIEAQMRHAEKMEAVGVLAGGIAHEFNNLLMGLLGCVSLVLDNLDAVERNRNLLEKSKQVIQRSAELVRQMLTFARHIDIEKTTVDLTLVLPELATKLQTHAEHKIPVTCDIESPLPSIFADQRLLLQILMNIGTNSVEALQSQDLDSEAPREILITAQEVSFDTNDCLHHPQARVGNYVMVAIKDSGPGISSEDQKHVFEPFFKTKPTSKGTGLGLAMAYGVMQQHGGWVECHSQLGKGTVFQFFFPRIDKAQQPLPHDEHAPQLPSGQEHLVIVDQDPDDLKTGESLLRQLQYQVVALVSTAPDLLEKLQTTPPVSLVIIDSTTFLVAGTEIVHTLRQHSPELKVAICGDYTQHTAEDATHLLEIGAQACITKPFAITELALTVRSVLDRANTLNTETIDKGKDE